MKAGIYIVKNKFSEVKYIVSLNGKEPFIRITNTICLDSFANGNLEKDHKVIQKILENPNDFEFTELSKEIETEPVKPVQVIKLSDELYEELIRDENILPDANLNNISVKAEIQAKLHITWEQAEELFKTVEFRYLTSDKWKKIEDLSTTEEANCVIQ